MPANTPIHETCDKCGKKAKLYLVQTIPKIKHFCRECVDAEGIYINPIHKIADYLV